MGVLKTTLKVLVIIGAATLSYVMYKGLRKERDETKDQSLGDLLLTEPLREFGHNKLLVLTIGGFIVYTWVAFEAQIVMAAVGAIVVYCWCSRLWKKIKPTVIPLIEAIRQETVVA